RPGRGGRLGRREVKEARAGRLPGLHDGTEARRRPVPHPGLADRGRDRRIRPREATRDRSRSDVFALSRRYGRRAGVPYSTVLGGAGGEVGGGIGVDDAGNIYAAIQSGGFEDPNRIVKLSAD